MKNKQNTSLMIKAIMLLLALIIMIFAASLAWFAPPDKPVETNGLSVKTSAAKTFEMAVGFQSSKNGYQYTMSKYSKNLNLRDVITPQDEHFDALADFSPIDITGDGVTLVRPAMQLKNKDIDRSSNTYTTVSPNKEYICFDLYFRAEDECKVLLDKNSFVIGASEVTPGDGGLLDTSERKAKEGDFNKDIVVGAVRVAFVNYDQFVEGEDNANRQNSTSLLWLPRPDIHLNTTETNENWTLSTGLTPDNTVVDYFGASDKFMGYPADTFTHHYYTYIFDETTGKYAGEDRNYPRERTVTQPNRQVVCDVDYKSGAWYYGKTQVNIWIEGCDAEARRAIAGGQFQVNLDLAGS